MKVIWLKFYNYYNEELSNKKAKSIIAWMVENRATTNGLINQRRCVRIKIDKSKIAST